MAEHTTLTSLFEDIAGAIRDKTGDTELISADDFPAAIENIPTGGSVIIEPVIVNNEYIYGGPGTLIGLEYTIGSVRYYVVQPNNNYNFLLVNHGSNDLLMYKCDLGEITHPILVNFYANRTTNMTRFRIAACDYNITEETGEHQINPTQYPWFVSGDSAPTQGYNYTFIVRHRYLYLYLNSTLNDLRNDFVITKFG